MQKRALQILLLTTAGALFGTTASVLPFARQPETYEPISAHIGQTVKLPCQTNLSAGVDWWNLENRTSPQRYVLAGGYVQNAFRPRFNVAGASDKGDYTLFIFNVQRNDTAFYICIEDNGFGNSHGYQLIVSDTTLLDSVTSQPSGGLRPAEVALIVILILFSVVIGAAVVFFWCFVRRRSKHKDVDEDTNNPGVEDVLLQDVASSEEIPHTSAAAEGQVTDIAEKIAETDSEKSRMLSEMEAAKDQQESKRLELEKHSDEENELKAELEKIKQKNTKLREQVDAENKRVMKLDFKLEQLRKLSLDQLTRLQEHNDREAVLNKEMEKVKESESELKRELEKEKDFRQKERENQTNQLLHEKQRLMAELQQIETAKKELMNKIDETNQKENKVSDKVNKAKQNENDLVQLLKREAERADQQKSKVKQSKRKIEKLRNELNSKTGNVAKLKERIEQMREQEGWMKNQLERAELLKSQLEEATLQQQKLQQRVNDLTCRPHTDREDELEQQLRQISEREQRMHDELEYMRLQLQQRTVVAEDNGLSEDWIMVAEDNRLCEESQKTPTEKLDSEEPKTEERKAVDKEVVRGEITDELKSIKENEARLIDQLTQVLQETAEKTDEKRKESLAEILQQMTNFEQSESFSAQEVFHHTWQMVNDLDTLTSQADVETMTRQDFKQKVVEMVKQKWVPRNKEYVEKGVHSARGEMKTLCDGRLRSLIEEISDTVRNNMKSSLKIAYTLQNACKEDTKLRDK